MDAPDEMVEAVADAFHAACRGDSEVQPGAGKHWRAPIAVALSVPALAEVIARDAKVREIVTEWRVTPWAGPLAETTDLTFTTDIAAMYPEAGK